METTHTITHEKSCSGTSTQHVNRIKKRKQNMVSTHLSIVANTYVAQHRTMMMILYLYAAPDRAGRTTLDKLDQKQASRRQQQHSAAQHPFKKPSPPLPCPPRLVVSVPAGGYCWSCG